MQKDIRYQGLSTRPSDYDAADGQLAVAYNLISDDNHLRPVQQPKPLFALPNGYSVAHIHHNAAVFNYILINRVSHASTDVINLSYVLSDNVPSDGSAIDVADINLIASFDAVNSVHSVGNTLVVLAPDGIHYCLWKDSAYKYLGAHLPELDISFGLQGSRVSSDDFQGVLLHDPDKDITQVLPAYLDGVSAILSFRDIYSSRATQEEVDAAYKTLSDGIMAKVNKFIADEAVGKDKFLFPFLVRYAYRLYDGSLTMLSSPVLMLTSSKCSPHAFVTAFERQVADVFTAKIAAVLFDLDYACQSAQKSALQEWSDIVTSVDIFVSAPIYTYDQSGKVSGWSTLSANKKGISLSKISDGYQKYYEAANAIDNYGDDIPFANYTINAFRGALGLLEFTLPSIPGDKVNEAIRSCSNFYLLKSVPLADLATSRSGIDIDDGYLATLSQRETLTDQLNSRDSLVPHTAFVFNNRLNIANVERHLANPGPVEAYFPYLDSSDYYEIFVYINQNGREYILKGSLSSLSAPDAFIYFYYPNPNAYKAVIYRHPNRPDSNPDRVYTFPLSPHDFLSGACYFCGFLNPTHSAPSSLPAVSDKPVVSLPNRIYSSQVDNPFSFPDTGVVSVGSGSVVGLATVTEPVSQGQFGYADIYILTSEGVWVAKITQEGAINSVNPVSRDVCINPLSITQTSNAVVFASSQGIMLLSGSSVVCISDALSAPDDNSSVVLPGLDQLSTLNSQLSTLNSFLDDCRIVFDYLNRRIVVFNPAFRYAYLYSLKSQSWATMPSSLVARVDAYPEALAEAVTDGVRRVVALSYNYDRSQLSSQGSQLLVTRPLKLGAPDTLKTVRRVIQRGKFQRTHVATVLYGSRDLVTWHLLHSSRDNKVSGISGTPYKYFRIAALTSLSPSESLSGVSVEFYPRHIKKML